MYRFGKQHAMILAILLLFVFALAACNDSDDQKSGENSSNTTESVEVESSDSDNEESATTEPVSTDVEKLDTEVSEEAMNNAELNTWLQQVNNGEIPSNSTSETIAWRLGYFTYYGSLESLGIDNMIYYALGVHRRLDTGEFTQDNLTQNAQNLLQITDGINYNSDAPLTDQIGQPPEVRNAILEHFVSTQKELSPQEALDSNNFIGVFAPPSPDSVGGKYLVFIQDSPDAEFSFLGAIFAVDGTTRNADQTSNIGEWQDIFWLGDASGPFWSDLPITGGADPTITTAGRPGVLLISEETFAKIEAGEVE